MGILLCPLVTSKLQMLLSSVRVISRILLLFFFFLYDCCCKQRTTSFALTLFDPHCVYIFIYYSYWIKNWCALYRRRTAQWQYKLTYCVLNFSHDSDVKFWWPPKVSDRKIKPMMETQKQQHKATHSRCSECSLLDAVELVREMCCIFAEILIFTLWGGWVGEWY